MPHTNQNRSRTGTALVLAVVVFVIGLVLVTPNGPFGDGLVRASYDSLHQLDGARRETLSNSPVVIVYLDLNSFGLLNQDPTHPWSRDLHAQLLRKLTGDGAKAVVFDIVFTTVLRILKAHGGFVRVESEAGQGTSFELFLPRAVEVAPVQAATKPTELPRGNGELILLADDEAAIRELVAAELISSGYCVLTATNGAEAVALFRVHVADVKLFITDAAMPVMDGAQAIAELRAINAKLPVILTSGEAAEHPGVIVVNKPFVLAELLGAIQKSCL